MAIVMGTSVVSLPERIYLDNAATSWPKPSAVYEAMDLYARTIGAAAGRGSYHSAQLAAQTVYGCRQRLQRLIHAPLPTQIALFSSGTAALNAAILGSLQQGDHVVTTQAEHNSVLRPLHHLQTNGIIDLSVVECDAQGKVDPQQLLEQVKDCTALVAMTHASNVTGAVQDVSTVGQTLQNHHALFLCDAAQTIGHLPMDVQSSSIDLLAAPGHKGTLGPLGTGFLYVSNKAQQRLRPTIWGGTGSQSESLAMPTQMPENLEPGNLNVPAIAGWNAGLDYLFELGPEPITAQDAELIDALQQCFGDTHGSQFSSHGFSIVSDRLPLVSLVFDRSAPDEIGSILDIEFGIQARCGLHCAALVHSQIEVTRARRAALVPMPERFD